MAAYRWVMHDPNYELKYTYASLLTCTSITQVQKHYRTWKHRIPPEPLIRDYLISVAPLIWCLHAQLKQHADRWQYWLDVQLPVWTELEALCHHWTHDLHLSEQGSAQMERDIFSIHLKYLRPDDFLFIEHHLWPCRLVAKRIWVQRGCYNPWTRSHYGRSTKGVQLTLSIRNHKGDNQVTLSQHTATSGQSVMRGPFPLLLGWSMAFNRVRRRQEHRWRVLRHYIPLPRDLIGMIQQYEIHPDFMYQKHYDTQPLLLKTNDNGESYIGHYFWK